MFQLVSATNVSAVHVASGNVSLAADSLPPFSVSSFFTEADLDDWLAVALVLAAGLYLYGVHQYGCTATADRGAHHRLHRSGLTIAAVTVQQLHAYNTAMLSVHMIQACVLSMVTAVPCALAP